MSYLPNQDLKYGKEVEISCDFCGKLVTMRFSSGQRNYKKNNSSHKCYECAGRPLLAINTKNYWTESRCIALGNVIKNSEDYKKGIVARPSVAGNNNPMFGKKASVETKIKMSASRMGKIGVNATGWKGGKCSVNRRVKGIIHGRYNWYYKIYERDKWQCVECKSKNKIDAHHIDPISKMITRLCSQRDFINDDEKVQWLIEQPEIIDGELRNGITLCRECHKKKHKNWGSHDC
jgi:hypothetical protein